MLHMIDEADRSDAVTLLSAFADAQTAYLSLFGLSAHAAPWHEFTVRRFSGAHVRRQINKGR
jgi:hypothetical protein